MRERAYRAVGVETPDDRRDRATFEANQAAAQLRRPPYYPVCAAVSCERHPTDTAGMPMEVSRVRRWFCPDHERLAQAGDLEPLELPVDAHMRYVDPDEVERERRRDERIQREQRDRNERRALVAREEAEVRKIREAQVSRELLGGHG